MASNVAAAAMEMAVVVVVVKELEMHNGLLVSTAVGSFLIFMCVS